ncbi:MAG: class B sortase [Oscillospiraceae bacterium]|jgi:sortase B|nr:class B sortase [Oscillospiraceae bacterium]
MHSELEIPVLLLGTAQEPPCAVHLRSPCRVQRIGQHGEFQAQLCFSLMLSDVVLVTGGYGGQAWPGLTEICEALSVSAEVPEESVRFRWIKDREIPLGAEFRAGDALVYVLSTHPEHAARMLRWLDTKLTALAPELLPPPPDFRTATIRPAEIERRIAEPTAPTEVAENPWEANAPPGKRTGREAPKAKESPPGAAAKPEKPPKRERAARDSIRIFKVATAAVLALATAGIVGSGAYLAHYAADSAVQKKKTAEISGLYHGGGGAAAQPMHYSDGGVLRKFTALFAHNSDTRGWISIPAVGVDRPVLQAQDNEYYLQHDASKTLSRYGALFLDTGDRVLPGRAAMNMSIYGHNTKNGTMFGQLKRFRGQAFYDANRTFSFDTLYEEKQWVIFAVLVLDSAPENPEEFFEWRGESLVDTPQKAEAFIQSLLERSEVDTDVEVIPGDRLLSLATCCDDFKGARLVVFARELRQGEITPAQPAAA